MSYPLLELEGNVAAYTISRISLDWGDDVVNPPQGLTRMKYDVTRETFNKNISQGVGKRITDIPFDTVRLVHTFVGYVDVLTQSVVDSADARFALNMALINNALIYDNSDSAITYNYKFLEQQQIGATKPSSGGTNALGYEFCEDLGTGQYKRDKLTAYRDPATSETAFARVWPIKNINISEEGHNVSRVTFTFQIKQPLINYDQWASILIDAE